MKKILPLAVVLLSTFTAQADLKSWLHGTPAPSTPAPPDATAASVSFASGVAPDKQILDFLVAFAEAVRLHDGAALKPRLSEKYVIEDMPEGQSAVDFFMQAMAKIKAPNEMIVTSVESARRSPRGQGGVSFARPAAEDADFPLRFCGQVG